MHPDDRPFMTEEGAPPIREITPGNCEILVQDAQGRHVPFDDGKDEPGWEYDSFRSLTNRTFRIPIRREA
jgi:hypothetical protein